MESTQIGETAGTTTLYLVVRERDGSIGYQAIGSAIMTGAIEEELRSSRRWGLLRLAMYQCYSPQEAAAAMRELAELGDVEFQESDFIPHWFQPDECIGVIDELLGRKRGRYPEPVRAELVLMRRALAEARIRGCSFYLVELKPGERPRRSDIRLAE